MCQHLLKENNMDAWIEIFMTILNMPVPENLSSYTEVTDEITRRDKHIIWKIKETTSKIVYKLFVKYGDA